MIFFLFSSVVGVMGIVGEDSMKERLCVASVERPVGCHVVVVGSIERDVLIVHAWFYKITI